ncbi:MAG: response regulator transcription factor [Casimicrobium sp.]|jgi:two-component system response regulator QseB
MRILIVEDNAEFASGVVTALEQDGYACDIAPDARSARMMLAHDSFDLVILDVGLPDGCGVEVLRWLRSLRAPNALVDSPATANDVSVLIVSARDSVEDRIEGLDAGSDDYLAKPVDKRELTARVRTLLRRAEGRSSADIVLGKMVLDTARRHVRIGDATINLSVREFALLRALAVRPGAVLSKAQLESSLYSSGGEVESNAIEVHIHNLRKKLGDTTIRTLRGAGYALSIDN